MLPRSLDNQKKPFWLFSRFPLFKIKIGLFISVGVKFLKTTKIDDIVWLFVGIWRVFPDKYQEKFIFDFLNRKGYLFEWLDFP